MTRRLPARRTGRGAPRRILAAILAVAGAAPGRGIGEAMMRTGIDHGRELGLTALALSSPPSMRAPHRIYPRPRFALTPARDR